MEKNVFKGRIFFALFWACFMLLMIDIAMPYAEKEPIVVEKLPFKFLIWLVGGFLISWLTYPKKSTKKSADSI